MRAAHFAALMVEERRITVELDAGGADRSLAARPLRRTDCPDFQLASLEAAFFRKDKPNPDSARRPSRASREQIDCTARSSAALRGDFRADAARVAGRDRYFLVNRRSKRG
jgi:hypothetical protein